VHLIFCVQHVACQSMFSNPPNVFWWLSTSLLCLSCMRLYHVVTKCYSGLYSGGVHVVLHALLVGCRWLHETRPEVFTQTTAI